MFYIETENLILKGHSLNNFIKLNKWENDREILHLSDDSPITDIQESPEETKEYLQGILENNKLDSDRIDYAIHRKENEEFIGYGQIVFIDRYNKRCILSICLGDKSQWGRGYAWETISSVINLCFTELELNRLGVEIFSFNKRSIALFEKLGFQREGIKREYIRNNDQFEDEYSYSLLKKDWILIH